MFQTVFKVFALLSACVHAITVAQSVIGFSPNYATSVGPVFIPGPSLNYPVPNAFLPATSSSQSAAGSSASQLIFPNGASASYSQSSVSGLPVTSFSQSTAGSSVSQSASAGSLPDPSVAAFSNSFVQAITSSNVFNNLVDFELPGLAASNFFRGLTNEILLSEGVTDTSITDVLAQGVGSLDSLSSTLFLDATGNTLGRFLLSRGLLTPETVITYPQIFLNNVENAGIGIGVSNADSLIRSVSYGFVNFINSLGFSVNDIASEVTQIFIDEITP